MDTPIHAVLRILSPFGDAESEMESFISVYNDKIHNDIGEKIAQVCKDVVRKAYLFGVFSNFVSIHTAEMLERKYRQLAENHKRVKGEMKTDAAKTVISALGALSYGDIYTPFHYALNVAAHLGRGRGRGNPTNNEIVTSVREGAQRSPFPEIYKHAYSRCVADIGIHFAYSEGMLSFSLNTSQINTLIHLLDNIHSNIRLKIAIQEQDASVNRKRARIYASLSQKTESLIHILDELRSMWNDRMATAVSVNRRTAAPLRHTQKYLNAEYDQFVRWLDWAQRAYPREEEEREIMRQLNAEHIHIQTHILADERALHSFQLNRSIEEGNRMADAMYVYINKHVVNGMRVAAHTAFQLFTIPIQEMLPWGDLYTTARFMKWCILCSFFLWIFSHFLPKLKKTHRRTPRHCRRKICCV